WLSSKVRYVSPVVAARWKDMYRNVAAAWGSAWLHPLTMFALPGVTPPAWVSMAQAPGLVSLLPPANIVSCACGSGEFMTFERRRQSRDVGSRFSVQKVCSPRLGVAWSPSPPWKLLPGNAHVEAVVKADALVAETPASASTKRAASRQTARRGQSGGVD